MKQQIKEIVSAQIGSTFDEKVFDKALAKYKRWLTAAFGEVDYSNDGLEHHARAVLGYYRETLENPSGRRTRNRDTFAR